MAARAKKKRSDWFAHAITGISVHYRDFEHAYVYWIWLRDSASYVITVFRDTFSNMITWQLINILACIVTQWSTA